MRTSTALLLAASLLVGCGKVGDLPPDAPTTSPDVPDGSTTLKLTSSGKIDLVAVQDSDGPWTVLAASAGVYTATLHGERFGLLVACVGPGPDDGFVDLKYATITDATSWFYPACAPAATRTGVVEGAIANAGADPVRISFDFGAQDFPPMTPQYSVTEIPVGTKKVIAQQIVDKRPVKLVVADAMITAETKTTVNVDFATGFAPITRNIASDPNIRSLNITYRDASNFITLDRGVTPFTTYRAFPGNQLGSGLSRLSATESQGTTSQFTIKYFKDPVDQTVPFLAPLVLTEQPTATKAPYPVVEVRIPKRSGVTYYNTSVTPSAPQTDPPTVPARSWFVLVTADWIAKLPGSASLATVPIKMPDFTGLAGWLRNFELPPGAAISWTADVTTSTVPLPNTRPVDEFIFVDGSLTQVADTSGELPPP